MTTPLSKRGIKYVTISENLFATSIAISYIKNGVRYITYANELTSNGGTHVLYRRVIANI